MDAAQSRDVWVMFPRARVTSRLRLFCFPYAGGGASIFRFWPELLLPAVEVCRVQLPGRQNRLTEPPFTKLAPLVSKLSQVLQPYLNVPFAFFGHSMGALIGFELARQLRRDNCPEPIHLFVASRRAPQLRKSYPYTHTLSDSAFIGALRRLNGTPAEVLGNTELMQLALPTLRADVALCETYVYANERPLNCPISAFGGLHDHEVNRYEHESWRDQTYGSFKLRMFPGDHFFLDNTRTLLLQTIAEDLQQSTDLLGIRTS